MSTKMKSWLSLAAAMLFVAGCSDLSAPNTNDPSIEELTENPTRAAVVDATQGLMITTRANLNGAAGVVSSLGIVGRESYNLDEADPRWVEEMLASELTQEGFGRFMWSAPYRSIRNSNLVLDAVELLSEEEMSEAEKQGVRGFAKTIQAYDFLQVINTRDENGAPIAVGADVSEPPAPIESKRAVFDHIVTLLDEAQGHLQSASAEFPFQLSSGFAGFDTPGTFAQVNRALRARVSVYMGGEFDEDAHYQDALDALSESFIDDGVTTLDGLNTGVYHAFSGASGDQTNALFQPGDNPNIRAHASLRDDAETTGGGAPDARLERKTRDITFREFGGVGSDLGFDIYSSIGDPIPMIRNEELLLLRAEANIGLENLEVAEDDINLVRQVSGGLPTVDFAGDQEAAIDQLLYERRYSLMFEGGHRWIDMRRHDRLDALPLDDSGHLVHPRWPFPATECDERGGC